MPAKSKEELQRHSILLYAGDYRELQLLFPDTGANAIIRQLVRDFIRRAEQPAEAIAVEVKL